MGRLAARDSNDKRLFKPQMYKRRGSYTHSQKKNYNQRNYQNRSRLGNRSGSRGRRQYGQGSNRPRFQQIMEGTIYKKMLQDMEDKIVEENIEMIGVMVTIEVGIISRNYSNNRDRSLSNSRSRSGSRASTNRDRIRCYNCREYDPFC